MSNNAHTQRVCVENTAKNIAENKENENVSWGKNKNCSYADVTKCSLPITISKE